MRNLNSFRSRSASATRSPAAWGQALLIGGALATVAMTTGFVSYTHISALTLELHQSWKTAHLTPIFIDGQIVIGSAYYMVTKDAKRWWGLLGIAPGLVESLFANWESGISHGLLAAAWALVAAQAFAVSSFLFERWLKERGEGKAANVVTVTVGCGHGVADDRDTRIRDAYFHMRDCLGGKPSYRGIGAAFDVHNEIVRQLVTSLAVDGGDEADDEQVPA